MVVESETDPPTGSESRYFAIVGALLVVIIVMLGALWLRERRAVSALGAELEATRERATAGAGLQAALSRLTARQATTRPLAREDLPAETVTWDGRRRTVLRVSASAGRRLGLEPGDAIVVSEPPASAPGQ